MKIFAYEVREDEKLFFENYAQNENVDLTLSSKVPNLENADLLQGFEGVSILGQGTINRELLETYYAQGIRYLSTRTIGYNHIDVAAAKEIGIQVCNAVYAPSGVADFTVMMMLMCLRQYKQAMWRGQVNDFSLAGLEGRNMASMTVGIIGTGKIGFQVIKNLTGFGCKMIAYDVYQNEAVKEYANYVDLDTLIREADIITLHMPLLPSTEHMINSQRIAQMKKGVVLINCARGELVDLPAVIEGIETMQIGALGMDTVEGEEGIVHMDRRTDIIPNRDWFYLHQFRNVIMTQHMAFYTEEAVAEMVKCGVEGLLEMKEKKDYKTMIIQ